VTFKARGEGGKKAKRRTIRRLSRRIGKKKVRNVGRDHRLSRPAEGRGEKSKITSLGFESEIKEGNENHLKPLGGAIPCGFFCGA